jgi:hypothetical protein
MAEVVLKFTKIVRRETSFYIFEGFENVKSRGELPCEYLSGPHFAIWNGILLYSDGNVVKTLSPGNLISVNEYQELMEIVQLGKERMRKIQRKMGI